MTSDRNGNWFRRGCEVWDIYTEKYGVVLGVMVGERVPSLMVLFNGEKIPVSVRPVCLEIVGMGNETFAGITNALQSA